MDGGDADVVDAPLDADDAAAPDIGAASALANFASPLRCITVAARWPSQPCFGSFYSILRRSNGKRRYPRLGFCFWTVQDRCDECGRPTCHLHGWKYNRPRSIARRFTPRMHGGGRYYDFACVHCKPNEHFMYTSAQHRMNYGGSLSEFRGWTEAFPDVDPITGRAWRHTSRDVRSLALDGIIDLTDSDTRDR